MVVGEVGKRDATFGALLRRYRVAAGWSQDELAERAGMTGKAVGALERGARQRPYPSTARRLADALGLAGDRRTAFLAAIPRHTASAGRADVATIPGEAESNSHTLHEPSSAAEPAHLPALPTPLTSLVGREVDLAVGTELLSSGMRLLTLTGPGGVGKTRLALALAHKVTSSGQFPSGVAFIALAPLADAALVLPAIAQALGLSAVGGQPLRASLEVALRARRLLLVLDNCEHVLAAAPEVARLLEACPALAVLATSRAALHVRGEHEYPVAPLALPTLTRVPSVDEVLGAPALRADTRERGGGRRHQPAARRTAARVGTGSSTQQAPFPHRSTEPAGPCAAYPRRGTARPA